MSQGEQRLIETKKDNKTLLVVCDPRDERESRANSEELVLLLESCDLEIVCDMYVRRQNPDPNYYIGNGNAEQMYMLVQEYEVNNVVIGTDLTPTQQRNLEDKATVRVIDRTQLILDIFARRARTNEGKIQTELAALQYMLPRLSGKGAEMDRIGSGSAGVAARGAGETKLAADRKRLRHRIHQLREEIELISKHREVQNKSRKRLAIPTAALVGYTSAGKSTLMNLLSDANVSADARLFETLDTTTRRVELDNGVSFILSDTVGFLRNLPHHLVAAFKATLSEVCDADFLIHVVDSSHTYVDYQMSSVLEVLDELKAGDKPTITVFNKSDVAKDQYAMRKLVADTPDSCYMSAKTGGGLQYLCELIADAVSNLTQLFVGLLPYDKANIAAEIHRTGCVFAMEYRENGIYMEANVPSDLYGRISIYE